MTTPILEPLLAVTAASTASAQREAPADDRAFRDLLAPAPQPADEALTRGSPATNDELQQPPVCSAPPPSDDAPARDESDEHEETDEFAEAEMAAAVAVNSPVPVAQAEASAELSVIDKVAAEVVAEATHSEQKSETPSSSTELPVETVNETEAKAAPVAQTDVAPLAAATKTFPAEQNATGQVTVSTVSNAQAEAAAASEVEANEDAATTEADAISAEQHSTKDVAVAHHDTQRQDNAFRDERTTPTNDAEQTNSLILAGQAVEPDVPAKRPAGRVRESEKRDSKAVGDIQAKNTVPPTETSALSTADTATPSSPAPAPEAAAEFKPTVTVDAAPARAEPSQAPAAPPATAERLGTILAQRRVKVSASGDGLELTQSQQTRLVQRVARAFDTARMRGETEIRLRLSPPELGSLKLEVRMESGVMTARLEVETVAAQQALADNLGTLRQRLAEQNVRVEQFDIDLMDRQNGNPSDSPTNQFHHDERPAQRSAPRTPQTERSSPTVSSTAEPRAAARASGGLDVLI